MVQQCANNDTATLIFCFEVSLCFAPFLLLSSCHRWYSSHCDLLWYSEVFSGIYCGIQWYSSPVLLWSTVVFRGHKERECYEWLVVSSDYCRLRRRSDSSNVMSRQAGKGMNAKLKQKVYWWLKILIALVAHWWRWESQRTCPPSSQHCAS